MHSIRLLRHLASVHAPPRLRRLAPPLVTNRDRFYKLIEYPKCGRTWIRYMINQAEAEVAGAPLLNTLHGVPYLEFDLPRVRYVHGFKVGAPLTQVSTSVDTRKTEMGGVVFMVRQPERVMISYYHQMKHRNPLRPYEKSLSEFIRDESYGIAFFVEYVEFYLNALEGENHMLLRYEDLVADPRKCFAELLSFVELDLPEASVDRIVENSSFAKMQAFEKNGVLNPSWIRRGSAKNAASAKLRSGGRERLETHLSLEDLAYIAETCRASDAFHRLGYVSSEAASQ